MWSVHYRYCYGDDIVGVYSSIELADAAIEAHLLKCIADEYRAESGWSRSETGQWSTDIQGGQSFDSEKIKGIDVTPSTGVVFVVYHYDMPVGVFETMHDAKGSVSDFDAQRSLFKPIVAIVKVDSPLVEKLDFTKLK